MDPSHGQNVILTPGVVSGDSGIGGRVKGEVEEAGISSQQVAHSCEVQCKACSELAREMAASISVTVVLQGGGDKEKEKEEEVTHEVSRASVQLVVAIALVDDDGAIKACSQCLSSVSRVGEESTLIDVVCGHTCCLDCMPQDLTDKGAVQVKRRKADDLLPRELWSSCLLFAASSTYKTAGKDVESDEELELPAELGILAVRATCVLFATLCLELLTKIVTRNKTFPVKLLSSVLLLRPRWLTHVLLTADDFDDILPESLASLFLQLSRAQDLEVLFCFFGKTIVLPGALICIVGEECTKLKELILYLGNVQGSFDSPLAFHSLERLRVRFFLEKDVKDPDAEDFEQEEEVEKKEASVPPNFAHFHSLKSAENLMKSRKWLVALADAPVLTEIFEEHYNLLSNTDIHSFCQASLASKSICTSLTSVWINFAFSLNDVQLGLLLDTFPLLEDVCSGRPNSVDLGAALMTKLSHCKHLKKLRLSNSLTWCGPTQEWLAASLPLFPQCLEVLDIGAFNWGQFPGHDLLDKKEYIASLEEAFRKQLPNVLELDVGDALSL